MKGWFRSGLLLVLAIGASLAQHPRPDASQLGAIQGRVLDAKGEPVPRANVYILRVGQNLSGRVVYIPTDDDGKFLIKGIVSGIYEVYATKEASGYPDTMSAFHSLSPVSAPRVSVHKQQVTSDVIVWLGPKAAKLTGRIVDDVTNKAIGNAQITLNRVDYPDYTYVTGPDLKGAFTILVPSAPFTFKVSAPGYEEWYYNNHDSKEKADALQLESDTTKELTIRLRPIK